MQIITIGKRLVPANQIAVVEPFDPTSNPEFKPEKTYLSRIVLLNRDTILTETSPQKFSDANGFHMLVEENVAINPSLAFGIETFEPSENFRPTKAYRTRIKWRDLDGNEQSKLLVMEPETVVLELSRRGAKPSEATKPLPQRPARSRRRERMTEAAAK